MVGNKLPLSKETVKSIKKPRSKSTTRAKPNKQPTSSSHPIESKSSKSAQPTTPSKPSEPKKHKATQRTKRPDAIDKSISSSKKKSRKPNPGKKEAVRTGIPKDLPQSMKYLLEAKGGGNGHAAMHQPKSPLNKTRDNTAALLYKLYKMPRTKKTPSPVILEINTTDETQMDYVRIYNWAPFSRVFEFKDAELVRPVKPGNQRFPSRGTPDSERHMWFTHMVVQLNEFNRNLLIMDLAEILLFSHHYVLAQDNLFNYLHGTGTFKNNVWSIPTVPHDLAQYLKSLLIEENEAKFKEYIQLRERIYLEALHLQKHGSSNNVEALVNERRTVYATFAVAEYVYEPFREGETMVTIAPDGFKFLNMFNKDDRWTRMVQKGFND